MTLYHAFEILVGRADRGVLRGPRDGPLMPRTRDAEGDPGREPGWRRRNGLARMAGAAPGAAGGCRLRLRVRDEQRLWHVRVEYVACGLGPARQRADHHPVRAQILDGAANIPTKNGGPGDRRSLLSGPGTLHAETGTPPPRPARAPAETGTPAAILHRQGKKNPPRRKRGGVSSSSRFTAPRRTA